MGGDDGSPKSLIGTGDIDTSHCKQNCYGWRGIEGIVPDNTWGSRRDRESKMTSTPAPGLSHDRLAFARACGNRGAPDHGLHARPHLRRGGGPALCMRNESGPLIFRRPGNGFPPGSARHFRCHGTVFAANPFRLMTPVNCPLCLLCPPDTLSSLFSSPQCHLGSLLRS